jgi:hypothetical protein
MSRNDVESLRDLVGQQLDQVRQWRGLGTPGFREVVSKLEGLGLSLK